VRKPGVPLTSVDGFTPAAVAALRDQLSVTTADEFADLAARMPARLRELLDVDEPTFDRLRRHADAAATPVDASEQEFRTGLDAPRDAKGRDTTSG
jgi:hypothetical protein